MLAIALVGRWVFADHDSVEVLPQLLTKYDPHKYSVAQQRGGSTSHRYGWPLCRIRNQRKGASVSVRCIEIAMSAMGTLLTSSSPDSGHALCIFERQLSGSLV